LKPRLDAKNIKLLFLGIGTADRAKDFAAQIDFPEENLYADPDSACYKALEFYQGVGRTFFNPSTPISLG